MISTKINPFALSDSGHRGSNIGVFVKEALGCPYNGYMQNYTRLSGTPYYHDMIVTSIIRAVSPNSHIYCRHHGNMLPTQNELLGLNGNPRIYIENYSLYYSHHISPYYTDIDKQFDNHAYYNDTVIFVANGNRYITDANKNVIEITPYTLTPAKALNVISVGNYDNSNDIISHSSNYINSQIKNEKPEIVAPGTNIDIAGYTNNNGTSYASPHAAGLAADMMSKYEWMRLKPYYFKAMMMAGSTKNVGGGADKTGVGGIDFHRTAYNSRNNWWHGSNSSFSYYDSVDPYPNNGFMDWKVMLYANKPTRAVIAWFNRGDYIYEHRNDAHPLGMDFDLQILDTNNKIVGHSTSWDNPYEIVDFIPATTGEYVIRIKRYANRDLNSMIKLGASVNIDY